MKLAGKCPPEREELRRVRERGFEHTELMLKKEHLDSFGESLEAAPEAEVEVVSIHTPHVTFQELEYFRKAEELAGKLDAFLVVHSQYMHHVHIPRIEEQMDFSADYGYENNPGASAHHLRQNIFDRDPSLALDTAHLYMAEEDYIDRLEDLLDDDTALIHLCDAIKTEDGLGFDQGEMDMEAVCKAIDGSGFDGILVLEVMPECQEEAREKWEKYTGR
ncbi:MAG: sugar phosphate isomerase/epimerase family protein [Candidatus Nanohaloarchaea archaeon]